MPALQRFKATIKEFARAFTRRERHEDRRYRIFQRAKENAAQREENDAHPTNEQQFIENNDFIASQEKSIETRRKMQPRIEYSIKNKVIYPHNTIEILICIVQLYSNKDESRNETATSLNTDNTGNSPDGTSNSKGLNYDNLPLKTRAILAELETSIIKQLDQRFAKYKDKFSKEKIKSADQTKYNIATVIKTDSQATLSIENDRLKRYNTEAFPKPLVQHPRNLFKPKLESIKEEDEQDKVGEVVTIPNLTSNNINETSEFAKVQDLNNNTKKYAVEANEVTNTLSMFPLLVGNGSDETLCKGNDCLRRYNEEPYPTALECRPRRFHCTLETIVEEEDVEGEDAKGCIGATVEEAKKVIMTDSGVDLLESVSTQV